MHYRPFDATDFPALRAFERSAAGARGLSRTSEAALRFYARGGHTFLAEQEQALFGFALAQAIWQGDRATVLITRLLAESSEVQEGLLRAVAKSSYDAGSYELAMVTGTTDTAMHEVLRTVDFKVDHRFLAVRVLGNRGTSKDVEGILE